MMSTILVDLLPYIVGGISIIAAHRFGIKIPLLPTVDPAKPVVDPSKPVVAPVITPVINKALLDAVALLNAYKSGSLKVSDIELAVLKEVKSLLDMYLEAKK
jgi:hypothetical protein